ncbi:MAG TPA: flagellar basal body rod protein FlgC [Candidatus Baltobacteraceae bacterium]|jgi:flagellar basal-body rod protein FlgC|nr:flagellar basal body rod protein FlgC [Candidatus Baltobacteraceae bacterium]
MGFYSSVEISASGLSAERLAMDVIANNIANANTTHTPGGGPFKRQLVVFAQKPGGAPETAGDPNDIEKLGQGGVEVLGVEQDQSPDRLVFDPSNPDADARGYVHYPNVSVVKEMVDMMAASRAYEANVSAMQEARNMTNAALNILRS